MTNNLLIQSNNFVGCNYLLINGFKDKIDWAYANSRKKTLNNLVDKEITRLAKLKINN
jgi:hypothetical protein